jgi:uncharacterized membrane protein
MASCNDRRRLAEQFALAAREYSEAVARLVQHEGLPSQGEYSKFRSVMTETLERCEMARVEFEQHVATHGCGAFENECRFAASAQITASAGV